MAQVLNSFFGGKPAAKPAAGDAGKFATGGVRKGGWSGMIEVLVIQDGRGWSQMAVDGNG